MLKSKYFPAGVITLLALVLIALATLMPSGFSMAAPGSAPAEAPAEAVITPVAGYGASGIGGKFITFFAPTPITVDTRRCSDTMNYRVGDFQTKLTQSGTNTVTVSIQNTNNNSDYNTAQTLMSGTPVPASTPFTAMNQYPVFGRYTCVFIDVTNTTPVSPYVSAVVK